MKIDITAHRWNTKYIVLAILGGCISVSGYLIYALHPLQLMVDKFTTLEPGSILHKFWMNPPYEVLFRIYVFNVTNSEEFLAGKEKKLNLTEVGPYVYQEILTNTESYFNDNNTLTFKPRRKVIFRRELSVDDSDESWILSPNIPLLGISSFIKDNFGYFVNMGFSSVANMVESPPVKNLTISEYLFGYEDPLVTLASTYIPSWIDFTKFGILDRLLAIDGNNTVTIHLSNKVANSTNDEDTALPYSINTFNGSPGLKQWGYSEDGGTSSSRCNTLTGAFDAGLFPKRLKENTTLGLYRRAFCRAVHMKFENTSYTSDGFKSYDYRIDQNFLSTAEENSENECYCTNAKECLPKGFGSLAPCYYGIPIVMSQPHYLNADPKILAQVNGLNANKAKHDTEMKVDSNIGVTLTAHLRIQINLKVSNYQAVSNARPFQGMIVPLFWIELAIDHVPPYVKLFLSIIYAVPTIEIAAACIFGLLGVSLIATSWLFLCYPSPHHAFDDVYENRVGYSPILVLPLQQHLRADIRRIS